MLIPFGGAFTETDGPRKDAPEVVPIDELTHDAIEVAETEIEGEENEWPATA
jgi:hypothetical protein